MGIQYCKKCLNVSTRPNIKFTEDGICPPCRFFETNYKAEPEVILEKLKETKAFAAKHNHSGYDCIVGVSGGKDSTRQALYVKEKFGLKPLLVSMNYPPEQISSNGVNNLSNLISMGFDCINISCSPQTWKKAMRHAFIHFGNWAKATEYALFASVPRVAVAYQIPLIWWGENAAAVLGEMGVLGKDLSDGNRIKYGNTLQGGNFKWLLDIGIEKRQILQFIYPSDEEMDKAELRIIFLDFFMKEFSLTTNGNFSLLRGLHTKKPNPLINPDLTGTSMVDEDFININMMLRYLKFGFGRTSDLMNEEIRYGRISREEAIEIVSKYDGNFDIEILKRFCNYIEIRISEFWEIADTYVNKELFERIAEGVYKPKFNVGVGL
ncbi:MAG: N-acetyl sugar amidotransferase [Bacteroidota bacterium]|jgi:N-acetyl sugar amidotransferase